ncbi:hypothetical protein [Algoriphagus sp. AK58]|uniref:hypothetical protein n=1 Tax=Algoriphagus sp. AK58 TaxID=1406877 RepID=UPI00164F4631|nr:hypothetical protein [Algoriphagus sp. AK58]MBC6367955.1 hypothetical protein [Algoriphagus sp. AK58]
MSPRFTKLTFSFLLLIFSLFSILPTSALAQGPPAPPTPVELMFGHERLDFQMVFKRNFAPQSKFSLLAIAVFSENYVKERRVGDSMVMPFQVNYALGKKGFFLAAGAEANSVAGFGTTLGLTHGYASKKWLAISVLNYQLGESKDVKLFGLYEYKPMLNEAWSIYSRLQFVYNYTLAEDHHNRSFLYLRAGLKKGPLGFGIGANWDQYGPDKISRDNYGLFTRWEF